MSNAILAFGPFRLDPAERRLSRDGAPVELSQRYFDALCLLARHPGELITKDRFMGEVWRGVPVTDEALTQCIRSLRRALGDEAARPRFIETVPKHGYRFIAVPEAASSAVAAKKDGTLADDLLLAGAGLAGGAAAGLVGGVAYGLLAANDPPPATGAISVVLVMTCLCLLVAMLGSLGVSAGIALGRRFASGRLFPLMLGGAAGGFAIGAIGRLIGLDAFTLVTGSRPLAITGGSEGLLIGAIAGAAYWMVDRAVARPLAQLGATGAALGAAAGLLVTAGGGQMMAGSLAALAAMNPDAPLGRLLGGLPPLARFASAAAEGAIFIAALTLAYALALRSRR